MTSKEFYDHAIKQNCDVSPIEGLNITGATLRFKNKKNPKLYAHLSLPLGDRELPDAVVQKLCINLGIEFPPGF